MPSKVEGNSSRPRGLDGLPSHLGTRTGRTDILHWVVGAELTVLGLVEEGQFDSFAPEAKE
jgi:hypothetical protein